MSRTASGDPASTADLCELLVERMEEQAVVLLDAAGRVVRWNAGARALFGHERDEVLGRPLAFVLGDERATQRDLRAARERGVVSRDGELPTRGGGTRRGSAVLRALHADSGALVGYGLTARDEQATWEAAESGRREAERRAAILALQQQIVAEVDEPAAIMQCVVDRVLALTGAEGAVVELVEGDSLVYRAVSGAAVGSLGMRLGMEGSLSGLCVTTRGVLWTDDALADPRTDHAASRAVGIRSMVVAPLVHRGEPVGVLKIFSGRTAAFEPGGRDTVEIVANLLAGALARALERQWLEAVLEALPVAVYITDIEGRLLEVNPAGHALWGGEVPLVGADRYALFKAWDLATGEQVEAGGWALSQALASGEAVGPQELEIEAFDGRRRSILNYARPFRDVVGRLAGAVAVSVDITARRRAEQRVRLMESVVASTNDAVAITELEPLDEPGPRIVHVNAAFTELTGYRADEVLGRSARLLQGPETDPATRARIRAALERREPVRVEILNYRKDGSSYWADLNIVPVRGPSGHITHWASVQRDITARREAEEAARRLAVEEAARREELLARQRMEDILESITDGFVAVDGEGRLTYVNRRAAELVGAPRDALVGCPIMDVFSGALGQCLEDAVSAAVAAAEPAEREVEAPEPGRWLQLFAYPSPEGGVVYLKDITARRRAEEALLEARTLLDVALSASAVGTWSWDAETYQFRCDANMSALYGFDPEQAAAGLSLEQFLERVHPDDRERLGDAIHHTVQTAGDAAIDYRIIAPDGRVRWITVRGKTEPGPSGSADRAAGAVLDITERVRAEEAIREANETLKALIDSAPIGIVALDLEGRVRSWNHAAERIFGWSEEEVRGQQHPAVPPERTEELELELQAACRGETLLGRVTERVRRDGERITVRVSTAPLHGGQGEVRGLLVLVEDITERTLAEAAQRRLTAILEATPDVVVTTDIRGNLLYVNQAGLRLFGFDEAQVSGHALRDVLPQWAALQLLREAIPRAIEAGTWQGESAVRAVTGREVPVSQVLVAHRRPDGTVRYLSSVIRDITERKEVERAQRFLAEASRALTASLELDEVVARITDLLVPYLADFCIVDLVEEDGDVRRVALVHDDPSRRDLLGQLAAYPPLHDGRLGATRVLRTGEPELVPTVTEAWLGAISSTEEQLSVLRALGSRSDLILPLRARGRVIGAISLSSTRPDRVYGASDLPLAEELAARASIAIDNAGLFRQTRQAVRTRDDVLRIVVHDLRNPLATVSLTAGALLRRMPPDDPVLGPVRADLEVILRSTGRAQRLVRDLLDVARIQAGRLSVDRRPEQPEELLGDVRTAQGPLAEAARVELVTEVEPGLPPVLADRDRMAQVFGNLVGNAVKFTPAGGRVEVRAHRHHDDVRFVVSDTGPGVPEDQLEHLFEPFWKAGAGSEGAGLGLPIAKGIIEAQGGTVVASSEPGRGLTLAFTVPMVPTEPSSEPEHGGEGQEERPPG